MLSRRKLAHFTMISGLILSAVSFCRPCFADPNLAPTTAPLSVEKIKCALTLSPTILDPTHTRLAGMSFMPSAIHLVDERPVSITKEPNYVGKPKYGAFRIGTGPRSVTFFAIDTTNAKSGKIYVDRNQNGDLTDDGPGEWDSVKEVKGGLNYTTAVTVHASWGTPVKEEEAGDYSLLVANGQGSSIVGVGKITGRVGSLNLDGKTYPIVLSENTSDGIFTVPVDGDMTRNYVTMGIDTENDAALSDQAPPGGEGKRRHMDWFNIGHPINIGDHWYLARPSVSGATLTVMETTPPGQPIVAAPAADGLDKPAIGSLAPDFTVQTPDGKAVSLSDLKGKVVIIDFWATWCGPCLQSMPGLEKLYQRVKDQGVVVLSVNVLDTRELFDRWIAKHSNTDYHFNFGFDPAGKNKDTSIATSKYNVMGIPRMFLITRDGKIAATYQGTDNEYDLAKALRAQGIDVKPE